MALAALLAGVAQAQTVFKSGFEPPFAVEFVRAGGSGPLGRTSDVALAWLAEGATSCFANGVGPTFTSFSGVRATAVAYERVALPLSGEYVFELACSSPAGQVVRTVAVTVEATPAGAPQATLSALASEPEVGEEVWLQYATNGASCTTSEVAPEATGWAGATVSGNNFQRSASILRPGVHAFTLTCTNASGTTRITRHANALPQPGCDPTLIPAGWRHEDRQWSQAFSAPDGTPQAYWPRDPGFAVPVGAPVGGIRSMEFMVVAPVPRILFFWQRATAMPNDGYLFPSFAGGMFFAISPCRGDVRPAVAGMPADPFLSSACRAYSPSAALTLSVTQAQAGTCKLEQGRTYWIVAMAANPDDGLTPGETTCETPERRFCDVSARHLDQ